MLQGDGRIVIHAHAFGREGLGAFDDSWLTSSEPAAYVGVVDRIILDSSWKDRPLTVTTTARAQSDGVGILIHGFEYLVFILISSADLCDALLERAQRGQDSPIPSLSGNRVPSVEIRALTARQPTGFLLFIILSLSWVTLCRSSSSH